MMKTIGTIIAEPQLLPGFSLYKSSPIDVSQEISANVFIQFATTNSYELSHGVEFRIEASSGGNRWFILQRILSIVRAPETLIPIESVSGTTITTVNNFGLQPLDFVVVENSTLNLTEWNTITSVGVSTLEVLNPFTNDQTGSKIYDHADSYLMQLDLVPITSIRLIADGSLTNGGTIFEASLNVGRV